MATSVDSLSIQITASTKSAKDRVDELCKSLENLVSAINSLDTSKFEALSNQANALSQGLAGLKGSGVKQVEKMAQALHAVAGEKNAFDPIVQGEQKVAEEAQNATKSEEEIVDGLRKLDATPLEQVSDSIGKVSDSLNSTSGRLSWFKSMLAGLKIIIPTEGLDNVNKKIDKLSAKVQDLKDKIAYKSATNPDYVDSKEMEKDQKQIEGLINELERLKLKKQELEAHGGFRLGWNTTFADMGKKITNANNKLKSFISNLHKSKSASRSSAKGTNEFSLSASKLAKELFRVSKMLKLMITRMALRAVIKEVGNGFKSLALHSDEFNKSMSGMINASKKLGYSFSAMVSPLINALAPALIYLLNILTRLINAINQIFSALTGKNSYNKAKDFAVNWAEDIEDANKKAKELKKTVLGFDELNQMQEKYTSGGDTSGNIEDMFETVEIESKWKKVADYIKNLAKRLFDPIKKAWQKVGDFVKKSWKYAMDEVLKLGKSIARDFWEVWEQEKTQKIFENILKIIGWIGQAVGNLAKRFREAWDKNKTGLKILQNIRDIVLIITEHLVNMAKATAEWADNLDFSPILTKFNEWLDSVKPVVNALMGIVSDFYETVILPLGKWAIEEGGPQLLKVFIDFNEKVKWNELRDKLKELWEHLEPFAKKVGEGLIMFIDDCAQALADFLNSQGFEDFLKAVEEWMDNVTSEDIKNAIEVVAKAFVAFKVLSAILSVLTTIVGLVQTVSAVAGGLLVILKGILVLGAAIVGLDFGTFIGNLFDPELYGQYRGLSGELKLIGDLAVAIKDYIGFLAEDFKNLLNPKEATDSGIIRALEHIVDLLGMIPGLGGTFANLGGHAVLDAEIERYNKLKESVSGVKDSTDESNEKMSESSAKADEVASKLENVGYKYQGVADSAKTFSTETSTALDGLDTSIGNISTAVDKDLKKAMQDAQKSVDSIAKTTPILDKKTEELLKTFENTSTTTEGLKKNTDDLKKGYEDLSKQTEKVTEKAKNAKDGMEKTKTATDNLAKATPILTKEQEELINSFKNVGLNADELKGTMEADWEVIDVAVANSTTSMVGNVKEMTQSVDDSTTDINKDVEEIAKSFTKEKWTFQGVADGLGETFRRAREAIKKEWNQIADTLNGEHTVATEKIKIDLPKFARGGFPRENGVFMANSSELVGRFDNGKTAVANNEQIIAGISQGVYSAVTAAMEKSNSGNAGYIANTIVVDGEVIARTVTKAQNKQNMRYSPVMG